MQAWPNFLIGNGLTSHFRGHAFWALLALALAGLEPPMSQTYSLSGWTLPMGWASPHPCTGLDIPNWLGVLQTAPSNCPLQPQHLPPPWAAYKYVHVGSDCSRLIDLFFGLHLLLLFIVSVFKNKFY